MTSWLIAFAYGVGMVASPAPAQAQPQSDVSKQIINAPAPESFAVYGLPAQPAVVKDKNVQGGRALRVAIPAASDQPWTIGLTSTVTQPVKKGDKLVVAAWIRAATLPDGATSAKIAALQINLSKAPYTPVFKGEAEATAAWKMVHASGIADRDYAAGELTASMQLATGKQVLDVGPILVLDLNK
ncbi:hypothetical protein [Sphingomonas sp. TDK1]|uniref:hypothetical protein n=1 Tax=Sphingomonas sp. TDK1 TaxID=453247 RepID=UPI0007D915EB|nr:hypothetical protein [Sphingomonas sp. TDK1]OAN58110.1 hypothetical protein A7X12_06240 [Sphingomonas sp. TDK1]